ncbi:hypothetical protein AFLA70_292g001391, partial [Aspergillus flavus AF70]
QHLFLETQRRPLIAVPRFNTKTVVYAAGGTGLTILGLMWTVHATGRLSRPFNWEVALNGDGVMDADRKELVRLRALLEKIASQARENNVRIVIDAEQPRYQPVIGSLTDELMKKYDTFDGPATCVASFQAYLRRYPQLLNQQFERADTKEGREGLGPVWPTKADTDTGFNYGMKKTPFTVAEQIQQTDQPRFSIVFATHNPISIDLGIKLLEKYGMAELEPDDDILAVSSAAAVYTGMEDDLPHKITGSVTTAGGFPLVVKSMSYGDLKECLPFLERRATENKTVLEGRGGAVAGRSCLGREICGRFLPAYS